MLENNLINTMDKVNLANVDTVTPRNLKFEQLRADYELFLQTFEKPTWIYRLLQRRQELSPFMLHRNLAYLRERECKQTKKKQQDKRAKFKVDSLLGKKTKLQANTKEEDPNSPHFMNLSFGGFFHGPGFAEDIFLTSDPKIQEIFKDDFVNVDIHLIHVYHKRKKQGTPGKKSRKTGPQCELEIFYIDDDVEGSINRWNIDPLPPACLNSGDIVKVDYKKEWYEAKMIDSWEPGDVKLNEKSGEKAKLDVFFIEERRLGKVPREKIDPLAPADLCCFDNVKAKFGNVWYEALLLDAWCTGPPKPDVHQPLDIIPLGECQAPWNPRTQLLLPCSSVQLSVPPIAFADNGRSIKTHIITITVSILVPKKIKKKRGRPSSTAEPPSKRHKSVTDSDASADDMFNGQSVEKITASYSAELIVYDKLKNCLLTDGDYELLLQENNLASPDQCKNSSWENKFKSKLGPFAAFAFGPTVKFSLSWASKPLVPVKTVYRSLSDPYTRNVKPHSNNEEIDDVRETSPKVFYQFIYNNSTRQQTEAREGTSCPWCAVRTRRLYGLLKHLKSCHSRFVFLYTPLKNCHRIDVCVNSDFEESLSQDGVRDIGFINVDKTPLKRIPQTDILVSMPYKSKEDFSEFTEPSIEDNNDTGALDEHERAYYHSRNNEKMKSLGEYDPAIEQKHPPEWLIDKTLNMIEEFTDLNEGEKLLMKMWNIHVLKQGYISDAMIAKGCKAFVDEYGIRIIKG